MFPQTCARVMLPESERRTFLKRFRRPNLENLARQHLCKAVNTAARKVVFCPYCGATNGTVKKQGTLKIVHEKFRAKKSADEMEKWKASFGNAIQQQKELSIFVGRAASEDLNALKVLDLFRRISAEVKYMPVKFMYYLTHLIGLRVARFETIPRSTSGIYLAVHICSSRLYSSFCTAGWRKQRRRPHSKTNRNSLYKRPYQARSC